jgi:NAD(P)-dependent dehydrogenase (short-subunit alcohol dehydrogenase family)
MNRLAGKVAFVSGAGGGIGQAICQQFLAEGACVAAADINLELAREGIAGASADRAIALACDVTSTDNVREAVARTIKAFGKLTVLCNTAGGSTPKDNKVTEAPEEEFWRAIKLDLFGTFLCCKHAIPEIIRAGGGSVINMTSMLTMVAAPERVCYTAAKGGVTAMTRQIAAEYAPHSIRANAIAPGRTLTPRLRAMLKTEWGMSERAKKTGEMHLLGLIEPSDIAHTAVFLASDESAKMTGQVLSVDSGVTIV